MPLALALLLIAPASLKRTPAVGARVVYAVKATIDLGNQGEVRYSGKSEEQVKTVEKGLLTTTVETAVTVDVMGVVREGRPVVSERVERLDGTIVTAAKADSVVLFATPRIDRLRSFYAPVAAVEIGAGWWRTEEKDDAAKSPPFSSYLKLEGEEKVGARDTWRVSIDANEVGDEHPAHVKGMLWIDKADGALERGQWVIDGFTFSATAPPGKARYELSRTD